MENLSEKMDAVDGPSVGVGQEAVSDLCPSVLGETSTPISTRHIPALSNNEWDALQPVVEDQIRR